MVIAKYFKELKRRNMFRSVAAYSIALGLIIARAYELIPQRLKTLGRMDQYGSHSLNNTNRQVRMTVHVN